MFKFIEKYKKSKRPIMICVHGFGKRRSDEFIPLLRSFEKEYDIIIPELFDQRHIDDTQWYNWVGRAQEVIVDAKNDGREIILIGFSMGGVIASYLASKFNIKRLILLAPAFEYLNLTTASCVIKDGLKKSEKDEYIELPKIFSQTFMKVVDNCKGGIEHVDCPVLFIAASDDAVIPYTVSLKYSKKVPNDKAKCFILANGQHRILDDEKLSPIVIYLIRDFINGKLD